uniref:Uncharacterized protein n=1 Tax=viral metagenome TaxID=1070528 RepID=A0A6M3KNI2_9ZZZZ
MAKYDELKLRQMLFEDPMNYPESLPDELMKRVLNGTSFYTLPGGTGRAMTPSGDWSAANEQARINMIAREEKARKSRDFAATWGPETQAGILAREDDILARAKKIAQAKEDIARFEKGKGKGVWDPSNLISHIKGNVILEHEGQIEEQKKWIRNARKELGVMGALDKEIEGYKTKEEAEKALAQKRSFELQKQAAGQDFTKTAAGAILKSKTEIQKAFIENQGKISPQDQMQFKILDSQLKGVIGPDERKNIIKKMDQIASAGTAPSGKGISTTQQGATTPTGAVVGRTKDGRVFMQTGQGKGTLDGIPVTFNPTDGNITYDITGKDVISLLPKRPDIGEIAKRVREEIGSDTAKVTQENIRNLYARAAKSGDWELRKIFENLVGNFPSKSAVSAITGEQASEENITKVMKEKGYTAIQARNWLKLQAARKKGEEEAKESF